MSGQAARIKTGATLAVVAAVLLWLNGRFAPGRVALVVVTGLALLASWELGRMGRLASPGLGLGLALASVGCCALLAANLFGGLELQAGLALGALYGLTLVLTLPRLGPRPAEPGPALPAPTRIVLGLWLLPPLFSVVLVDREYGTVGLVVLIVLAKIGDNAGYFVGRAIGKRHPFPRLSPGKTVAGCVASLAAGTLVGALVLPPTLGGGWALGALTGALVNVAAQAGDLSESWFKRLAGVKDSSHLVGPSGGILDVIDSLLVAGPVALAAWLALYPARELVG